MLFSLPLLTALPVQEPPGRVFGLENEVDKVLARPYTRETPFASSGERVWATSPQGWAFREGVNWLYYSNSNAFDVRVLSGAVEIPVSEAVSMPSHVKMSGRTGGSGMTASASFTYNLDDAQNPLEKPFMPAKRWTCWSSGKREDWYSVKLGGPRRLEGIKVWFFNDLPTGECAPPESVSVKVWDGSAWAAAPSGAVVPVEGLNHIRFHKRVETSEVRLSFKHKGEKLYTGIYGFEPIGSSLSRMKLPLKVEGAKWISDDDVLVSIITIKNVSRQTAPFSVQFTGRPGTHDVHGFPLLLEPHGESVTGTLKPGETREFRFAMGVGASKEEAVSRRDKVLAARDPLADQIRATKTWYNAQAASFRCSDPKTNAMFLHRVYNLKKNSMDPKLGRLSHKTFAEGRWRSGWYANVISYGAGHQVREARWLSDPDYAWGHLETFAQNQRPDGIYPSHVTPKGQMGGKYTDWISATAWDAYLVHPDKTRLAASADALARNTEGWRKVYGWGGSPLLVVDDHWWTGMEWQPSFFSFNGHKTDRQQPLRRVDLTAYNYGNEVSTAKVMRELGRISEARKFESLAAETRKAVLAQMWNPLTKWFHSLHSETGAPSPDREIIGVYPFTFGLPPKGQGYEEAWRTLLDPRLFWTKWPLASVAKDSPAYAQNGWPVGSGGSICMWNGPSWPHANSLVLTGMANSLRESGEGALKKTDLFALFKSFTEAQFKDGHPWTGEFYNGETAEWKTGERDYNHSTWLDPLIHDLIGITPQPDGSVIVDPLIPQSAWSWWALDGQRVRGHKISLAWDSLGGRVAKGFKGFAVYVDGKEVFASSKIEKTQIKLK